MVSFKGRLSWKLQSKSTLSCEIVQIHSLFRHDFIKKLKSKFNRNRSILFLCDGFRKTDLGIDLIANAFRVSIQNTRLFRYFLHLFSVPSFIFSKNGRRLILAFPQALCCKLYGTKCVVTSKMADGLNRERWVSLFIINNFFS